MTEDVTDLEEHAKAHEEEASSGVASSSSQKASCALCMEPTSDLEKHLIEQHRIAESAIEKFLLAERTGNQNLQKINLSRFFQLPQPLIQPRLPKTLKSSREASTSSEPSPEFPHRCSKCSMAFRSESQLQTHSLQHVFQSFHKCPTCGDSFDENNIVTHMLEHTKEECEMCSETFPSKEAFLSHLNSARHLQQAKKQLESTMVDLNSQDPTSSEKQRVYVCNVCKQSYPQAANLDVHMRSVTHQSRMGRLAELVANGDLNPEKPVFEQPGIPAQTIQSFIETTSSQPNLNDLMSLLTRSESDDVREEVNGLQLLTQIRVYGEPKITSLVPGLDGKIDNIALFDDQQALEISKIDCGVCGQQIVGILALNLHYEESHSSKIPSDVLRKFGEKILVAVQHINRENKSNDGSQSPQSNDDEPLEKKIKMEHNVDPNAAANQFAMFQQMMSCFPFMAPPGAAGAFSGFSPEMLNQLMNPAAAAAAAAAAANVGNSSTQKRARTRITDDQLKVLRQYFNINNSPSEAQIKEMSQKSGLPEKVIKHWFRNTLFKERQRDKDSPYNFSIPPQMGIDLDVYEKTGETKVHSLSSETPIKSELSSARATPTLPLPLVVEEKKLPEKIPETKSQSSSASSSQLNLQAMLSQMQNNFFDPTTFMAAAANPMTNPSTPSSCNTTSSGRRANRTRFTDFQLRTLQQFFDKQAYPKDDDLEALSKKLQLSPRVIVVWFQNARQKARKIYENQPNHENSDRFVRTPGSNFQCKRCNQVFQRYYELIQHQQKKCYKDDGAALASDNKSVEESLTDEEKAQLLAQQQVLTMDIPKFQPADLLKMIGAAGGSSSSSDVLMKMCENIGFHKTCLFCQQEFRDKNAMTEHMNQKHNMAFANIDVDMMPDASDMFLDNKESALDLSGSSVDYRESISTSPPRSEDDVLTEQLDDSTFAALLSNGGSGSECRSPASSSKRFRTHLTPMQVQMMKSVFNEYKTPSMAECELLGKEVGLHKRVVQVWFQNARAKERKTRGTVDEESRSGELNCEQCDKSFGTRLALQDHLFTAEHIGVLRAQLKKEGVSELTTASVTECSPEKKSSKTAQNAFDLSGFPFLNPLIDIQMYGTPIQFLQVPEEIKTQISTDIKEKKPRTVFSQDGLNVEKLKDALPENEKSHLTTTQKEVGWACPTCTFVFQEEKKLREHQRQICQCDKTSSQPNLNDLMSLLTRSESDDVREEVNGLQLLTQIRVYGEPKITSLVPGLDGKIDNIALFDDQQALEISKIDCGVCGQQIVGILALNLHYEESHSSKIPSDVLRKFGEKILVAVQHINRENKSNDGSQSPQSNDDEPLEKKIKMEHNVDPNAAANQFAMFQQMMSCFPFMAPPGAAGAFSGFSPEMLNQLMNPAAAAAAAAAAANVGNSSTQKRARTRITDDQLKVLRQYFNINNSPSEAQIKEMSQKSGLPEKVIKHWFRNTLFKERQRDKDSPYNFSIPPQMGIDLDVYEKTGETKVHSLSSETPIKSELSSARATPTLPLPLVVEEKKLPEKIPETKSQSSSASSSQLNLQAMLSQMQNNFFDPTTFMAAAANPMTNPSTPSSCNTTSSGRRANRTRFTDFQLRTLQQFFDKQAYPKDDDLEALSKKLQLSPRVIVVWFQNARQKARKIYENQPNHENSDRFVRTPGSNFQCKRCNQVFQRYYELIQHQQKKCYKDDGAALASDNKSVEESLTDEEKAQLLAQQQVLTMDIPKFQPADLLKMIGAAGGSSSSSDVLMKMCENIGFHKTCLFCQQEFRDKNAMTEHMNQKHNMAFANIDVDMMPDASDMFLDNKESALDLSGSSVDYRESISTSPPRSEDDVLTEQLDDSTFAALLSNGGSGSECRSPASSSKRFRTHLTPMQVQMMKSVFNEYKTPSMAECELLGKEVGLHKRVVQVWFQNARAKERKTRGTVDEESRSGELNCEQCDKSFGTRLALQDHLFTAEHIGVLRAQLKKEGVSELTTASVTECSPEKKSSKTAQNAFDLSGFPFLNPLIDIQMYGTPIQFLQVPEEIKTQISTDIKEKKPRTVFSQDGLNVEKLKDALPENEKSHLTTTQKEVGWACPTCTFVFQEEKKLREHQRQICQCDKTLTLVQTHYSCKSCKSDFCLQSEYLFHLSMPPHI
ncbi:Protein CBR-ZFH-2 [Caenorhabditis briggsae]|uniref:Protein CBR-ZFH-2 n=1 Tax=Caenorhabditis briggsae TaxID=6238 RepID=A8WZ67_CAEBR|nr:Protein CBR-ZFH-2 [Caenorhabditis briggsae]CAP25677.2 Protein CBR-ZFH-2 [Caenorhabditis briggsae]